MIFSGKERLILEDSKQLIFLPLGGSNEIGMNLNAYGFGTEYDRKWIIVDCGVTFASEEHNIPGVEIILPDPEFLVENKDDILGMVLTHAHEDHIGAIGYLWPLLETKLFATPFTASLIRDKLRENGILEKVELIEVPLKGKIDLDPFEVEYITITHSIAEPNGLKIKTPLGTVFHTGDWKIDPNPIIGEETDVDAITQMGNEGVLAMVCDSTNVFQNGESGSEETVAKELEKLVSELKGKVAVACFASNVARVFSVVSAAHKAGRSVCLLGRSMIRIVGAARSIGLFADVQFIEPSKASKYKDDDVLYICTGSQGEKKAALSRIAEGNHPSLNLKEGDNVVFSSREIPGNERDIYNLINSFTLKGVNVVTAHDRPIHVSGHPCRDELARMYSWVKPQIAIPTHGERRHLIEHARFAKSLQINKAITPKNGDMVLIAPNGPKIIDEVANGRLLVDGNAIIPFDSEIMGERRRIAENGYILINIVFNQKGRIIGGPDVRSRGLAQKDGSILSESLEDIANVVEKAIAKLKLDEKLNEELCEDIIVKSIRKFTYGLLKKKPMVEVVVMVL